MEGFWFEVKPLSGVKADFSPLLSTLHSFGGPFSFILVTQPLVAGKVVKVYFRAPDENLRSQVAQMIKNSLAAEIVLDEKPEERVYSCCIEVEMVRHYSRPILAEETEGLTDRIYEAVHHFNGALEVTFQADHTAKTWVYREIVKMLGRTVKVTDFIPFGEKSSVRKMWAAREDPYRKTMAELMMKKYKSKLFTCTVKVYAETKAEAEGILKAMPSHLNRLRRFKALKNTVFPEPFKKPSRHTLRNLCSKVSLLAPLAVLYLCWRIGFFSPGQLLIEGLRLTLGLTNMLSLFLAFLSLIAPLVFLRKKNAVVLSAEELSAIVNMPQAVDRISLEYGETPMIKKAIKTKEKIAETPVGGQKPLQKKRSSRLKI